MKTIFNYIQMLWVCLLVLDLSPVASAADSACTVMHDLFGLGVCDGPVSIDVNKPYPNIPDQSGEYENKVLSCTISWPRDITISQCVGLAGSPSTSGLCSQQITFSPIDHVISECKLTLRSWTAINWTTGEQLTHVQRIVVDRDFPHQCNSYLRVNVLSGDQVLTARQLIIDADPSKIYSFSPDDESDSTRVIKHESPFIVYFHVYNLTDTLFCIARIEKTVFYPDLLEVQDNITVHANQGVYKLSALDFVKNKSPLPQGVSDVRIAYNGNDYRTNFTFSGFLAGNYVSFVLRFKIGGNFFTYGIVRAYFEPLTPVSVEPIMFYAYDRMLEAGQEYFIPVYSSNFVNVIAFQFQLNVNDASLLGLGNAGILNPNSINLNESNVKILWLSELGDGINIPKDSVVFSLQLRPEKSGLLSDFIELEEKEFAAESVYDGLEASPFIIFEFLQGGPSSTADYDYKYKAIRVAPNPVIGNNLNWEWYPGDERPKSVKIIDAAGRIVSFEGQEIIGSGTHFAVPLPGNLINGMYILQVQSEKGRVVNAKFILHR